MMRSFVVAFVTIAAVSVLSANEHLAAISQQPAAGGSFSYPIDITGGTPGVQIEIFLNSGKVGDAAVGTGGDASWVLDMGNVGKTRVTVYVDVCKDGKVVKVAFVTGDGTAPPDDEGCNRRIAGVGWWSDCGVTRVTIDIRSWGAQVIGCATPFYQRPVFIGTAGALAVVPFLLGGDDGPTALGGVPQQPSVFVPPASSTNVTTQPPPVQAPVTDYTVTFGGITTFHPPGANTSFFCGLLIINPAISGATYIITASGPAVLPNQNVMGTFSANGQAAWRVGIGNLGTYAVQASVMGNNVTKTATANHSVTSANGSCPSVP